MNIIDSLFKYFSFNWIKPKQLNEKYTNQAGFDLRDKPENLRQIKNHFDKLNLYSDFDVEILQDENSLNLNDINYAIVAGFAVWSGYSYSISHQLLNQIKDATKYKMRLIIIDIDCFSYEIQKKLFGTVMHGYFECCLIKNGEIIQKHRFTTDVKTFIDAVMINNN